MGHCYVHFAFVFTLIYRKRFETDATFNPTIMTLFELFEVQRSNQVFLKGRPLALRKGISSTVFNDKEDTKDCR